MVEHRIVLEGFNHREQIQPSKPQQIAQWSMVVIRDSLRRNDLSIFPPANHENLQISVQKIQKETNPPSKSTILPSSDVREVNPVISDLGFTNWAEAAFRILRVKISGFPSIFGTARGAIWSFCRAAGMASVVLVWWLCKRARQRRWNRRESVSSLKNIIREKDEKIVKLLHQIAQMNQLLVAAHRNP